jgi:hypothetical protein
MNLIRKLIDRFLNRDSVEGVLSAFQRNIDQLRAIEAQQKYEAEQEWEIINEAQARRNTHLNEADRAKTVAAKFNALIGA